MTRLAASAALAIIVVLTLAGCLDDSDRHPATTAIDDDIVGTWAADNHGGDATISFASDESFQATGFPGELICEDSPLTFDGHGIWKLALEDDRVGRSVVEIDWRSDDGSTGDSCEREFYVELRDGERILALRNFSTEYLVTFERRQS